MAVADILGEERAYCFEATFPFGTSLMENGEMSLLTAGPDKVSWKDEVKDDSAGEVCMDFRSICSGNTDHALSVVLAGEVEVYSWRPIRHHVTGRVVLRNEKKYFPLNRLIEGDLLGLFGASDVIEASLRNTDPQSDKGQPWSAIAGRRCVTVEVPKPIPQFAPKLYRDSFCQLFPNSIELLVKDSTPELDPREAMKPYADIVNKKFRKTAIPDEHITDISKNLERAIFNSICSFVNMPSEDIGDEHITNAFGTSILIIPDVYFGIDGNENNEQLVEAKLVLQRRLLAGAWRQSEGLRDTAWKQALILPGSAGIKGHHARTVLNHLVDVIDGRAFALRSVNEGDTALYSAWSALCDRWTIEGLWSLPCFPLMLTYDRGIVTQGEVGLVLPLLIPSNSLAIEPDDIVEVENQFDAICGYIKKYAYRQHSIHLDVTYEREQGNALGMFMDLWGNKKGDIEVGSIGSNGERKTVRPSRALVKTGKGGNLKSYHRSAFILQRL